MDYKSCVIKVHEAGCDYQATPFNFEDLKEKAHKYLDGVRAEAARLIAEAQQQAAVIRKQAESEGQKAGLAQGEKILRSELEGKLATVLPALREVINQIHQAKQTFLVEWEREVVRLAGAMAARLVRQKVIETPELAVPVIREAIELAARAPRLRIRLHPEDEKVLRPVVKHILQELSLVAVSEIIADEEISRGGCRIETQLGSIDEQFEKQVARMVEELTGE